MSTPTLSKPKQKKAQSSKKISARGLKNVLTRPDDYFCPYLKNDPDSGLENLLKRLLPILKRNEKKIPWSQIRKMSKEDKSSARKAALIQRNVNYNEQHGKSIGLGINSTTKLLEKDDVCCILLDGTFEPSVLTKYIIVMAKSKNIPILIVSFLKKVTLETIGFTCAAIGLKDHVKNLSDNYFNSLYNKVLELFQVFITSKNIPMSQNELNNSLKSSDITSTNSDKMNHQKMEIDKINHIKPCVISTDLYLYRKSTNERIFNPSNKFKNSQQTDESENCEYLMFQTNSCDENDAQSQVHQKLYHSLRVKRLKGNENRKKSGKLKVKK